jgi:putative ABC transport system ATP-binding protein
MSVIDLDHVTKTYQMGEDRVHALNDVTLSIRHGEFVAIIGASGSGKSTLLNIIGCLDRPTDGSYQLAAEEVSGLNDEQLAVTRNRKIGFVFQNFLLLPRMSALHNVALPLVYAGVDRGLRLKRAAANLALVGLAERSNHRPNELSGGQRQRVAIARALINDPPILIADEPTGNLDSKSSNEIMDIFCRLKQQGRTIIMVTHEPDIAAYAGRVVQVRDGKIVRDEPDQGVTA